MDTTNAACDKHTTEQMIENITSNRAHIDCLNGRIDRVETALGERYTKTEVDCKLAGKADRCAFEKHLVNSCAHRRPCGPCDDRPGCECDCYTRDETDALLDQKVTKAPQTVLDLPLPAGYIQSGTCIYYKTSTGVVHVHFAISDANLQDTIVSNSTVLTTLPADFRPAQAILFAAVALSRAAGENVGIAHMKPDGNLIVNNHGTNFYRTIGSVSFLAKE